MQTTKRMPKAWLRVQCAPSASHPCLHCARTWLSCKVRGCSPYCDNGAYTILFDACFLSQPAAAPFPPCQYYYGIQHCRRLCRSTLMVRAKAKRCRSENRARISNIMLHERRRYCGMVGMALQRVRKQALTCTLHENHVCVHVDGDVRPALCSVPSVMLWECAPLLAIHLP